MRQVGLRRQAGNRPGGGGRIADDQRLKGPAQKAAVLARAGFARHQRRAVQWIASETNRGSLGRTRRSTAP